MTKYTEKDINDLLSRYPNTDIEKIILQTLEERDHLVKSIVSCHTTIQNMRGEHKAVSILKEIDRFFKQTKNRYPND